MARGEWRRGAAPLHTDGKAEEPVIGAAEEEGRGGQALGDDGFVFPLPVCVAQTPPPHRPHPPSIPPSLTLTK